MIKATTNTKTSKAAKLFEEHLLASEMSSIYYDEVKEWTARHPETGLASSGGSTIIIDLLVAGGSLTPAYEVGRTRPAFYRIVREKKYQGVKDMSIAALVDLNRAVAEEMSSRMNATIKAKELK